MAKNTGKEYERLTQAVFNYLNNLERDGMTKIEVEQHKIVQGKTTDHEIDVYWEFRVGIVTHKVIIQAKDWSSAVKKEQLLTFKAIIDDIPNTSGIFVSRSGFQKGAIEVAVAHGIKICELRTPIDSDWDGLIKDITIEMHALSPYYSDIRFDVDGYWAKERGLTEQNSFRRSTTTDRELIFNNGERRMLKDIFYDIANKVGVGLADKQVSYPDGAILDFDDNVKWKIVGFSGKFGMTESVATMVIHGGSFVDYVLKEIVNGEERGEIHMLNTVNIGYQAG